MTMSNRAHIILLKSLNLQVCSMTILAFFNILNTLHLKLQVSLGLSICVCA